MPENYITNANERSVQQLLALHQLRSSLYGPGAFDKEQQQQYMDDLKQAQENRAEQSARDLKAYRDSLTSESQQRIDQSQNEFQQKWGPGGFEDQRSQRDERRTKSLEALQAAETTHAGAETTEAQARTGLINVQTKAAKDKAQSDLLAGQLDDANRTHNKAISMALQGQPFDTDSTNRLEKAERLLSNMPNLKLPRNDDGSWKYDPQTISQAVMNPDGTPNAAFSQGMRHVNEPWSVEGKLVDDIKKADAAGWTREQKQPLVDALRKKTTMLPDQVEGDMLTQYLDATGDPEGALEIHQAWHQKAGGDKPLKPPTAAETTFVRQSLDLKSFLNEATNNLNGLEKDGIISAGKLRQPYQDLLATVEAQDPRVGVFNQNMNLAQGLYMQIMHGRRFSPAMEKFIMQGIPNKNDSYQVLRAKMENMQDMITHEMGVENGMLQSYGYRGLQGVPTIDPADVLNGRDNIPGAPKDASKNERGLPALDTPGSYTPAAMGINHVKGIEALRRSYAARNIGGIGAFRDQQPQASMPDQTQGTPASVELMRLSPEEKKTVKEMRYGQHMTDEELIARRDRLRAKGGPQMSTQPSLVGAAQ